VLYSAADVFVYPSFYEGFGLPVLEAMACGTPVAASNRTSLPEVVGDAGLLFDPDDIDAMATAIQRLVDDRALRDALVAKGLARVKDFTWQRTAARTLAVLTELA
jgi:alpha-1,3-rhamnosyl/mannosyltransferase